MSLPKKAKYNINVNPLKIGTEYLKYGWDRIEELMNKTDEKTKYLPRSIHLEDLDGGIYDFVDEGHLEIIIDGKKVPAFYLDNDRWGEFEKTWKFTDNDKNVLTPYITVRRTGKKPGTRLGGKARIPQPRKFRYLDVPILDNGEVIYLRTKMPEPTNVDMVFEVSLFTKFRVDVNDYDEQVLKNFASKQDYIFVNGTPFPIFLESMDEANPIENIDGDRFFVSKYTLTLKGYILDEKEFEITKTLRKPRITYFAVQR
jgi:hypothetical protein